MGEHRSADPQYDTDFFAWTQHQARLLRTLQRWRSNVPEQLDLDHVAEEIEDLGSAELNSVRSLIRQIFVHLLKAASDPLSDAAVHWEDEAMAFHAEALDRYAASMRRRIDVDALWKRARRLAEYALRKRQSSLAPGLPVDCPFRLEDIIAEDFRFDDALERLRPPKSSA